MRKIHLILLTALIAVFVFFIPSSHAQSDISLVDLNYTDTKNWHCNVPGSGDTTPLTFIAQSDLLAIIVDAEVATGFTNKDIRLDFLGDSVPTDIFNVSKNSFRTKICYTMHPAYASCGDAGVDSSMYDVSRNVNAYDYLAGDQIDVFWRTYFFEGGCDTWGWNSTFTIHSAIAVYDGPPPAWIKPVSSLQAGAWGQSQINILYAELEEGVPDPFPGFPDDVVSDLTVMASSDEDDDYVHAATEGTVIEVRRGTRDDCRNFLKEWRRPVGGYRHHHEYTDYHRDRHRITCPAASRHTPASPESVVGSATG